MKSKNYYDNPNGDNVFSLSIGDLMTGLLMIFILLLMGTLLSLQNEFEKKSKIAEKYTELQTALYTDLKIEFDKDLKLWNAEIDPSLSIRFKEPDVLFAPNRSELRDKFKEILDDFIPRYFAILNKPEYRDNVEEIRIEGHTANPSGDIPYMNGMVLSQERTRSVLAYVISMQTIQRDKSMREWVLLKTTANGLSSSRPILTNEQTPDWDRSRRVEFRVRTNAEEQIKEIIKANE